MDNGENKKKYSTIERIKTLEIEGERYVWYDLASTTSTMNFAVDLVKKGCLPWTIVTARHQVSGRGTHGRNWVVPQGKGLLLSLVIPPILYAERLEHLQELAAVALIETLSEFFALPFHIKLPNDVLIEGRKVAGILFESALCGKQVQSLILGVGLNLYQTREDFECAGLPDATSLYIEGGNVPERESLLISFLKHFRKRYETLSKDTVRMTDARIIV
ncbi:MAG TPA: biotin--[acetyl-CoA-carboxylase] ligase [Anaerolineae bacterium]|nr:biotin--[acetyl-CoA-carboxylase] ligase [Anaerolineae bacterium]